MSNFTTLLRETAKQRGKLITIERSMNFDGYVINTDPPTKPHYVGMIDVLQAVSDEVLVDTIVDQILHNIK